MTTTLSDLMNDALARDPQQPRDVFPLLLEADGYTYEACRWDLREDDAHRDYWLALFRRHYPALLNEAVKEAVDRGESEGDARTRAGVASERFLAYLDALMADPHRHGRMDILTICYERERILRAANFMDPFRLAKHRENEAALALLPSLIAELEAMDQRSRAEAIVVGMFAGNIFDLGATDTAARFMEKSVDFREIRSQIKPRPWLVDDLEPWLARLQGPAHRAACLFVDNAGSDVLLGMLPLARELLKRGTKVILAANATPSLNDITHDELLAALPRIAAFDGLIANAIDDGQLLCITSGNAAPLIDLNRVWPQLNAAVVEHGVDLVVLEGMGRGIESNFDARFACDAMKVAMIKDRGVAGAMGGDLYDVVLRFEAAR
jgi:type II pantothenate kinase